MGMAHDATSSRWGARPGLGSGVDMKGIAHSPVRPLMAPTT